MRQVTGHCVPDIIGRIDDVPPWDASERAEAAKRAAGFGATLDHLAVGFHPHLVVGEDARKLGGWKALHHIAKAVNIHLLVVVVVLKWLTRELPRRQQTPDLY